LPHAQRAFEDADAAVGQRDIAAELVESEMRAALEPADDGVDAARQHLFIHGAAGEHQRDARFVDEDGIGLVDHGGVERPVHLLAGMEGDLVAQEVEADFVGVA
jgi:hypothetical protein